MAPASINPLPGLHAVAHAFQQPVLQSLPARAHSPCLLPTLFPCRLLGAGVDFGPQTDWGCWESGLALDPEGCRPWLFVAQQKRLSLGEMETYEDHVAAAMEVDEDFLGTFREDGERAHLHVPALQCSAAERSCVMKN